MDLKIGPKGRRVIRRGMREVWDQVPGVQTERPYEGLLAASGDKRIATEASRADCSGYG